MKHIYFLPLFLLACTSVFSQQKNQFGFVAGTGIHNLPSSKTEDFSGFEYNGQNTNAKKAGQVYQLGIWYGRRLNPHVRLTAELLFRRSATANSHSSQYVFYQSGSVSGYSQHQQMSENSIALPVKLHFSFRKDGKTTLSAGLGISRSFSAVVNGRNESFYEEGPDLGNYPYTLPTMRFKGSRHGISLNLSAGIHHRLDNNTSIGLEYTFEQSQYSSLYEGWYYARPEFFPIIDDCFCYGYSFLQRSNMNSFSVSLRHNILD